MSIWENYPSNYREQEVQSILAAVQGGECVSVLGLSGSGKSNLLGFITHREDAFPHPTILVDCNRLVEVTTEAFYRLTLRALGEAEPIPNELTALDASLHRRLSEHSGSLTLLFDRFDVFSHSAQPTIFSNLRALRDTHKYRLTYVTATRRPLDPHTELAELFFAHTLWLGPLSDEDAYWNIDRYARRIGRDWDQSTAQAMITISGAYPALLRAVCEAYAAGVRLDTDELASHPAVQRRLSNFWADEPSQDERSKSGLEAVPLLNLASGPQRLDAADLTAKEHLLLEYFRAHPDEVCEKEDLVRAVWSEDQIYERGIRDDSLAQLVRRLRVKIEPDPSEPRYIHTVTGRGYRFTPQTD